MTTWLVLGASPGAPRYVDRALEAVRAHKDHRIAVANSGILLLNERGIAPHYMGVLEEQTPDKWFRLAPPGTIALTTIDAVAHFNRMGIPMPFPRMDVEAEGTERKMHAWNKYNRPRCCGATGGFLIQMAVKMGGTEIHVVGCEGYRSTHGAMCVDTFDGQMGLPTGQGMTYSLYGLTVERVVSGTSAEINWTFYGDMAYDVAKHGAKVVKD